MREYIAAIDLEKFAASMVEQSSSGKASLGAEFSVAADANGMTLGSHEAGDVRRARLRMSALETARFLSATPSVEQQIADARVLLVASERWSENACLRPHLERVLVWACGEAETAAQAVALADQVFSFLTGEVDPPAAGGR
ncbi:hypothetical protein ACFIQF_22780 [Comamonas sp. J-3]|uniref:hypothetical protein n=1 Tax=Comamonas trifloxystrobinivorans TaxID=3350256 RepID=UPI0037297719